MPLTSKQTREVAVCTDVNITGTGALTFNVFQLFGSVRVLEQYAEIKSVTTLTNATAIYSTLYDGTNTVNLTANGAVLSGAPVGTIFTKDKDSSQVYTVSLADQCRMNETTEDKRVGKPFIFIDASITQEASVRPEKIASTERPTYKAQKK